MIIESGEPVRWTITLTTRQLIRFGLVIAGATAFITYLAIR
jgi:hypothetical protein